MNKYLVFGLGGIGLFIISLLCMYYMVHKTKRDLMEVIRAEALEEDLDELLENQEELHKYLSEKIK